MSFKGNTHFLQFDNDLDINQGTFQATLLYSNGRYYVRLQTFSVSDLAPIFPNVLTASPGSAIKAFGAFLRNTNNNVTVTTTIIFVKEDNSTIRLICSQFGSDTSGSYSINYPYAIMLREAGLMMS